MTLTFDLSEEDLIDLILTYLSDNPESRPIYQTFIDHDNRLAIPSNNFSGTIDKAVALGLVHASPGPGRTYTLAKRGYKVLSVGGWKAYLQYKREKKELIQKQIQSAITSAGTVASVSRTQTLILWITAGLSAVSLIVSWAAYYKVDSVYLLPQKQQTIMPAREDTASLSLVRGVHVACPHGNDTICCHDSLIH